MKPFARTVLDDLIRRRPEIAVCRESIEKVFDVLCESWRGGGKLLVCGNGGSASDASHLVGELMKGFSLKRELAQGDQTRLRSSHPDLGPLLAEKLQGGLPALDLSAQVGLMTAVANDNSADLIFAQSVWGLGRPGDVLLGISTSGNSKNVIAAMLAARVKGLKVIALTGPSGGKMKEYADITILAPGRNTPEIQESHLPIYHAVSMMVEQEMFAN